MQNTMYASARKPTIGLGLLVTLPFASTEAPVKPLMAAAARTPRMVNKTFVFQFARSGAPAPNMGGV